MHSKATTVDEYLRQLPPDRLAAIEAVRTAMRKHMDKDLEEGMQYGMIGYYVPHRVFAAGYHCDPKQPLPYAGLASQKGHMSLYLMCTYGNEELNAWFRDAWAKTGKKLDMGKACIRFKKLDDLALDVIAESLKRATVKKYLAHYQSMLASMGKQSDAARGVKPAKKAASKRAVAEKSGNKKPAPTKEATSKKATSKKAASKKASAGSSRAR
ncbi:MAG: DUF1801 domain-containing protein [Phycisphaerales bacterium]